MSVISMFSVYAAELETCKGCQLLVAENVAGAKASEDLVQNKSAVAVMNINRDMME